MLPAYAGPCGSRPVAWLDGMVEILVSVEFTGSPQSFGAYIISQATGFRKALKPASDSRLQDFLGTLQSFEAYTPNLSWNHC